MMKQVKFRIPLRMMAVLFGLVLSIGAYAQITVNGHVKDATGEPIIGATIRVAGQDGGTVSDFDGNFQIKAPQGATLNVTYVGYQPANVKAAPNVVITLQDDAKVLENVVVIGYGVQKKKLLTGANLNVKGENVAKMNTTNPLQALQGQTSQSKAFQRR